MRSDSSDSAGSGEEEDEEDLGPLDRIQREISNKIHNAHDGLGTTVSQLASDYNEVLAEYDTLGEGETEFAQSIGNDALSLHSKLAQMLALMEASGANITNLMEA